MASGSRFRSGSADADVSIEKLPGESLRFDGRMALNLDAGVADIEGEVELRYDGSDLYFHADISVDIVGGIEFSAGVSVDTRGCFGVDDVGTVCL